jgi:tetratricopeptide (TPR) repeat protein
MTDQRELQKLRFQPLGRDSRELTRRIRGAFLATLMGFFPFYIASMFVPGSFKTLLRIIGVLCIIAGMLFTRIMEAIVDKIGGGFFWPETGRTARAHSEGEALVQKEKYEEAVEWFTEAVACDPKDWQAQVRIVELLTNQIHDVERAAEARNRLLKMEGIESGLWINTALRLGRDWEDLDRPDRAINTYKSLLWKHDEGYDADEVRRRLAALGAQYE